MGLIEIVDDLWGMQYEIGDDEWQKQKQHFHMAIMLQSWVIRSVVGICDPCYQNDMHMVKMEFLIYY